MNDFKNKGSNLKSKALVYTVSFGSELFHEMTRLCISSLRTWGQFKGEVAVLSDRSFKNLGPDTYTIKLAPKCDPLQIKLLKSEAYKYLDTRHHSVIAYIDTDILAVSKIAGLLHPAENRISCIREAPFNTMLHPNAGGHLLKFSERRRAAREWAINTGFLCMRKETFPASMRLWSNSITRNRERLSGCIDQPCFNSLVFQGKLHTADLPLGSIEMPLMYCLYPNNFRIRRQTKLLHFLGPDKAAVVAAMRKVYAWMEKGRSLPEIQEEMRAVLRSYAKPHLKE